MNAGPTSSGRARIAPLGGLLLAIAAGCGPRPRAPGDAAVIAPAHASLAAPDLGSSPPRPARDPAPALIAETLALPVRGVSSYWGVTPPADCAAASAADDSIRFVCAAGLEPVVAYFAYYYPMLPAERGPGGLRLGGEPGTAVVHLVELPGPEPRAQLMVYRPRSGRPDPAAEAERDRLRRSP